MKKFKKFTGLAFAVGVMGASGVAGAALVVNIDFLGSDNGVTNPAFTGQGAYATDDAHYWNSYVLNSDFR
jgi:hypothetical protein